MHLHGWLTISSATIFNLLNIDVEMHMMHDAIHFTMVSLHHLFLKIATR